MDDKIENTRSQLSELIFYLEDKDHLFKSVKLLKSETKRHNLLNVLSLHSLKYTKYCEQSFGIKVKPYFVHKGKYEHEVIYDHAREIIKILKYISKKINYEVLQCAPEQDELFLINKSLLLKMKKLIPEIIDTK